MSGPSRRILLLGHTGFIGSALAAAASRDGHRVVGRSSAEADLTSADAAEALAADVGPDTVLIVCSGIRRQSGDTLEAFDRNVAMALNVARLVARRPPSRVVFFSSAAVYGETYENERIAEDTPPRPVSYYGIAKLASEGLLAKQAEAAGCSFLALRPPLVYGPGVPFAAYGPNGFIEEALSGRPIALWGDGTERREFLFLDDLVRLTVRLALGAAEGVLNAASGRARTFRDAVDVLRRLVPGLPEPERKPRSKPAVHHGFDPARLRRALGPFEFTTLEDGMRATLEARRAEARGPR